MVNLPRYIGVEVRAISYETLFIVAINFNAVTEFDGSTSFKVSSRLFGTSRADDDAVYQIRDRNSYDENC